MKTVVTRCKSASVKINKKIVGSINEGLLVLVGFTYEDSIKDIDYMVDKIINLRIFNDNNNVMNKSALELNKQILINHQINGEIIALNGSGFTNDYADKYYAIIRRKERKNYVKKPYFNRC